MPDSPVPVDAPALPVEAPLEDKESALMPSGNSVLHGRPDSPEIWRLACRLRLGMREDGLGIKDAHTALLMAYPDVKISQKDLKKYLEDYVDTAIVVDPSFWRKGMMKAKAKLNAVAAASEIAEDMQEVLRKAKSQIGKKDGPSLSEFTLASQRAISARATQFDLMAKIGMGPQTAEEHAQPTAPQVIIKNEGDGDVNFNLADAVGGSFARRSRAIDVEGKAKAAG